MVATMTRRALVGGGATAVVDAVPGRTWLHGELRDRHHEWFGPHAHIPSAPEGRIRLEQVSSRARGTTVDLFTAVPHGHGDGAGLPVCVILHGVTGRPSDYQGFGLGRFLTDAVQRGAPPFVLAGADGGVLYWEPDPAGGDDPQRMMTDEMPRWLAARGYDASRIAGWGWSMGGYGVLRLGEVRPGRLRAVAAFSPDVTHSPAVARSYGDGAHTRAYWDSVTLPAFAFLGGELGTAAA
jgi:hypothetical protein